MSIVTINEVHKAYGPNVVFDRLSLHLYAGEKVGMVGANGSGKSTLLKLILGEVQPDMGEVFKRKGLRIGYLSQEPQFDCDKTILEEMHTAVDHLLRLQNRMEAVSHELSGPELQTRIKEYGRLSHLFEHAGGYEYETRIRTTLAGVGFDEDWLTRKVSALSGGQLSRLGLAKVLMLEADLLLLDEPTNHLDLQATEWLERFLAGYEGAAVIISHDRYLLDKVARKIVEVEGRQARVWKGNYSQSVETRETLRLEQQRQYEQRTEMIERTLDFIARNKDQEGMRGTAKGRKTRLRRLLKENPDFLDRPQDLKTIAFSFAEVRRKGDLVLRCEGLSKAYGEVKLLTDLTFDLLAGQRLGITGPNGTGKSTLLKLAMGQIEPSGGLIRMADTLKIGYLDQHGAVLDPDKTVIEEALAAQPGILPEHARSKLGTFLFLGDDVFKKTCELSGGQRNRLMLCTLVLSAPDVLVMDEPTNHLDIASREMLEEALDDFTGALIVVSHDRFFLDRVADRLLVIGCDELGRRHLGLSEFVEAEPAYTAYAARVASRVQARQQKQSKTEEGRPRKRRPASSCQDKPRVRTPEHLKCFNKYTVEQVEQMITDLETEIALLKERFGDPNIYKQPQALAELQQQLASKTAELDLLYQAYEWRITKQG